MCGARVFFNKMAPLNKDTIHLPKKLPLSRDEAKGIFKIDSEVHLPRLEAKDLSPMEGPSRTAYLWRCIVPAAFSWFRYFETTKVEKWGLNKAGYTFEDCIDAIRNAMTSVGFSPEEIEVVAGGELYPAYQKYKPGRITPYRPNAKHRGSPEELAKISQRNKASRRLKALIRGKRPRNRVYHSKWNIRTVEDAERLFAHGHISRMYLSRIRRRLGGFKVGDDPWLVGLRGVNRTKY